MSSPKIREMLWSDKTVKKRFNFEKIRVMQLLEKNSERKVSKFTNSIEVHEVNQFIQEEGRHKIVSKELLAL